jgi:hypothetical protein
MDMISLQGWLQQVEHPKLLWLAAALCLPSAAGVNRRRLQARTSLDSP